MSVSIALVTSMRESRSVLPCSRVSSGISSSRCSSTWCAARPRISPRLDTASSDQACCASRGRLYGGVDVGRGRGRDLGERAAVGGIDHLERVAGVAVLGAGDERARVGGQRAHAPTNSGLRFSTNACSPSSASLDLNSVLHQLGLEREPVGQRQLAALVHAALDRGDRECRRRAASRSAYSRTSDLGLVRRRRRRRPAPSRGPPRRCRCGR